MVSWFSGLTRNYNVKVSIVKSDAFASESKGLEAATVTVEQRCIQGGKSALHYHCSDIKTTDTN